MREGKRNIERKKEEEEEEHDEKIEKSTDGVGGGNKRGSRMGD